MTQRIGAFDRDYIEWGLHYELVNERSELELRRIYRELTRAAGNVVDIHAYHVADRSVVTTHKAPFDSRRRARHAKLLLSARRDALHRTITH